MTSSAPFWDKLARRYAKTPIKDQAGYERWLARVREHLGPESNVLEVGCGTGSTALLLAPSVKSYLSTDFAAGMIEIANEKLAQEPQANLRFVQADPFDERLAPAANDADGGYDAVLAFNFLHLTEDPAATNRRLTQLVKPGGLLITKTVCLGHKKILFGPLVWALRLFGKAPTVRFMTTGDVDDLMTANGLDLIETITFPKIPSQFVIAHKPAL